MVPLIGHANIMIQHNSGSLFQQNVCNLFLLGIQLLSVLSGCPLQQGVRKARVDCDCFFKFYFHSQPAGDKRTSILLNQETGIHSNTSFIKPQTFLENTSEPSYFTLQNIVPQKHDYLPGALQLNTSGAKGHLPVISASRA